MTPSLLPHSRDRRAWAQYAARRNIVLLEGGPMAQVIVTATAPALDPNWSDHWPKSLCARHAAGAYELVAGTGVAIWRDAE